MQEQTTSTMEEPRPMGLPITNAKLAMWLFLATEIMFFSALIGAYIVLRFGAPFWPTVKDVHLVEWMGAVNTFVLICSSVSVVLAFKALTENNTGRAVLCILITFILGGVFMVIKSFEYRAKYDHHLLPGWVTPEHNMYETVEGAYRAGLDRAITDLQKLPERSELQEAALTEGKAFLDKLDQGGMDRGERIVTAREIGHKFSEATLGPEYALPFVVPAGNLWCSLYFTLTGIHALHVLGGMVIFLGMLIAAMMGKFGPAQTQFVEMMGLYWHFVDIVWIFLFPLLYLVA